VQLLSTLPELEKEEKLVKLEKYVGYSVGYKNIEFYFEIEQSL
tara:strand:+ start:525 stop:653 length:129 start_codon:yes stop_codon:yes gene_type:complete